MPPNIVELLDRRQHRAASPNTRPAAATPAASTSCFADGSVKFIKSTVATQPWWAIGTRANNEVVSADQF